MKRAVYLLTIGIIGLAILMATDKFEFEKPSKASQYPPSVDFKEAVNLTLNEILKDKLYGFIRDDHYKISTFFESIDGYAKQGNVPTLDELGVHLATAASLNSTSILFKQPTNNILSFREKSYFKIVVTFDNISNVVAYLTVGQFGISEEYYGFELSGATLKGSSSNANTGSSNAINLKTISAITTHELKVQFNPNDKVIFYVNDVEVGSLKTELPSNNAFSIIPFLQIKTTDTSSKTMHIDYFEYGQIIPKT